MLLEAELADLVQTTVGPLSYGATSTMRLPFDVFLTDAADRDPRTRRWPKTSRAAP